MTTRRPRTWADRLYTDQGIASGSVFIDNLLTNAPTRDTITVARLIGKLQVHTASTDETESSQIIDLAIGVSSVEAFNLGATALPDPNTEGDYPPRGWLYATRVYYEQTLPTGGTPTAMWRVLPVIEFDLGAMRRIDKGVLFMIVRNTSIDGAATNMRLTGRVRAMCLT